MSINFDKTMNKINLAVLSLRSTFIDNKIHKLFEKRKKLNHSLGKKKEFKQASLAPKILSGKELKKIQPYIDRLGEGVQMSDVHNIALMSSYGAGKSTILRNFEKNHPEYNFLNLSLGSYSKKDDEVVSNQNELSAKIDLNEKLENSLVKQMIYREKKSKLPYSRFKKINKVSKMKMTLFFMVELLAVVSFLFLIDFLKFQNILENNFLFVNNNYESFRLICYVLFLVGLFYILSIFTVTILRQFKLSKLSVGNVSIEGNDTGISYFNKYIDEILYYFESNKFNVVIIEDVDRFGTIRVFEHLKELNILLNNSKQINREITFIYAIREDIFSKSEENIEEHESELRTKFFELIIPIIPVLDTFNSRDYLVPLINKKEIERQKELAKKREIADDECNIELNENELVENSEHDKLQKVVNEHNVNNTILDNDFVIFLKDISLYIQDLRLLNNIVNEYYTFLDVHGNLSKSMDEKSLFSLITLKNLFPSVYTELQKSNGKLYDLIFAGKYDDELIKEIKKEISDCEIELQDLSDEINVDKVHEAKKFFFDNGISIKGKISVGGSSNELSNLNEELINKVIDREEDSIRIINEFGHGQNISKEEFTKIVKESNSVLQKKYKKKNETLDELNKALNSFDRLTIKDKLEKYPTLIDKLFPKKESSEGNKALQENDRFEEKEILREKNFILFLISNGYLAEDYSSYLSIFYEGMSLTAEDKNILVKLKSNQRIGFNDDVNDVSVLVGDFSIKDFEKKGILNVNILIYIFSKEYIDKYDIREVILELLFYQNEETYNEQLDIILGKERKKTSRLILELVKKFKIEFFVKSKDTVKDELVNRIFYSTIGEENDLEFNSTQVLFDILDNCFEGEYSESDYPIKENILSRPNFFKEISVYSNTINVMRTFERYNSNRTTSEDGKIYFEHVNMEEFSNAEYQQFLDASLYNYSTKIFETIINYKNNGENKAVSFNNILALGCETLTQNIEKDMPFFVEDVLLPLEELFETEESILKILNLEYDGNYITYFERLIEKSNVLIEDLSKVENQFLWNSIIRNEKYKVSWINIIQYKESEFKDLELIKDIFNQHNILTSLEKEYADLDNKENVQEFLNELVDNKMIEVTEDNINLLKITKYKAHELNTDQVRLLIENNLVVFNIELINYLESSDLRVDLLLNYPEEYIRNYDVFNLSQEELIKLIKQWQSEDVARLLETIFSTQSTEFFKNLDFVDALFSRKVPVNDEQMFKLVDSILDIKDLKDYFIFNLDKNTLGKDIISQVLELISNTSHNDLSKEEYNSILNRKLNHSIFVKVINYSFEDLHLTKKDFDLVIGWLKNQDKPYSELYIGQTTPVIIDKTSDTNKLLVNLRRVGVVSTFSEIDGEKYKVNNKRTKPDIGKHLL
ncbi:hypothetical protein JZO78_09475 [Enterococcus ureilyticus]|nr:hypothetical protein [Enterococcus ureilyticus]